MKKLHFENEMHLLFSSPVWEHYYRFHCIPMENDVQTVTQAEYQILPGNRYSLVVDGFGSQAFCGSIRDSHISLTLRSSGDVVVELAGRRREELHPMYRYPSSYTIPEAGIRAFGNQVISEFQAGGGRVDCNPEQLVTRFMNRLMEVFAYVPGTTDIHTTASQALALGTGVCQDYAHILISLCRLAGIPARYVAGMLIGEGASHAWVEVYLNGYWIGADPTHDRFTDETYIKLSHGRDYEDCTIDRGCFKGAASQSQKIYVKVEEIV